MNLTYTRLANGQISSVTSGTGSNDTTRSWSYGYDGLGRLISANNTGSQSQDRSWPARGPLPCGSSRAFDTR